MISRKRLGLFGGTFNPIHFGHLRAAEEVREACALDEVVFIPAAIPPHKETGAVVEARHRLQMIRLATKGNSAFSISTVELERPGTSYSVDTVRFFLEKNQGVLYFILGRDAFMEIETWREYERLFSLSNFVVMARPGLEQVDRSNLFPRGIACSFQYDERAKCWIHVSGQTVRFQEVTVLDISSTKIRNLIGKGHSVKYLVPAEVEAYIQEHGFYREGR